METVITPTKARKFIETLGVPKPSTRFIKLFYHEDGRNFIPRFNTVEMEKIFKENNYPKLAEEYHAAKKENNRTLCEEIFQKAAILVPKPGSLLA